MVPGEPCHARRDVMNRRTRSESRGSRRIVIAIRRFAASAVLLAACSPSFRIADYPDPVSLYQAGMEQFRLGEWENAVAALEQATLQLPARDTLLPLAHYYLAEAHARRDDHQLAAASYLRVFEAWPGDTLADEALLGAARSYEESWRGPEFDPDFAQKALEAYELVQRVFPASPLVRESQAGEARMSEALASKELNTGNYYFRRNAFESAIIYYRAAATDYPGTPSAREARFMIIRAYQRRGWTDEVALECRSLKADFPDAADVRELCGVVAADTTS